MNIRTAFHDPSRAVAALAVAGLLFAACGTSSGAEDAHAVTVHPRQTATETNTTADAEFLWSYLAQLPAADRDQVLLALNPDLAGALHAIFAGMLAAAH